MSSIRYVEGKYRAQIRRKGIEISKTFLKKEDAELWSVYKEDLIDQIHDFDPPLQKIITLRDAIDLKINNCIEKNVKDLGDFKILYEVFKDFLDRSIDTISYDDLLIHFDKLMKIPIRHGGSKLDLTTGNLKLPSTHTTFRKFGYLSAVFSYLKDNGTNIENTALQACQFLRKKLPKKTV